MHRSIVAALFSSTSSIDVAPPTDVFENSPTLVLQARVRAQGRGLEQLAFGAVAFVQELTVADHLYAHHARSGPQVHKVHVPPKLGREGLLQIPALERWQGPARQHGQVYVAVGSLESARHGAEEVDRHGIGEHA